MKKSPGRGSGDDLYSSDAITPNGGRPSNGKETKDSRLPISPLCRNSPKSDMESVNENNEAWDPFQLVYSGIMKNLIPSGDKALVVDILRFEFNRRKGDLVFTDSESVGIHPWSIGSSALQTKLKKFILYLRNAVDVISGTDGEQAFQSGEQEVILHMLASVDQSFFVEFSEIISSRPAVDILAAKHVVLSHTETVTDGVTAIFPASTESTEEASEEEDVQMVFSPVSRLQTIMMAQRTIERMKERRKDAEQAAADREESEPLARSLEMSDEVADDAEDIVTEERAPELAHQPQASASQENADSEAESASAIDLSSSEGIRTALTAT